MTDPIPHTHAAPQTSAEDEALPREAAPVLAALFNSLIEQNCPDSVSGYTIFDAMWPKIQAFAAPQPVSGDAPLPEPPVKFKHNGFEHAVDSMAQGVIDSHPGSTLTAAYRAVALELFPTGDAPKVEEIAAKLAEAFRDWRDGKGYETCKTPDDVYATILRPYFPPASQTPEIQAAKNELLERFASVFDSVSMCEMATEIRSEIVATPASTARTERA